MKTLYEAANAAEAHVLCDLLEQEGVVAHVHGEHLEGAIGELPAAGLVRLVVDDSDYDRGRALIDRWEAEQPAKDVEQPPEEAERPSKRRSGLLAGFALGLVLGVGGAWVYFRAPSTVDGLDYDGDGALDDTWTYSASGRVVKDEADRNFDGKVDYVARFDTRGFLESIESDDDFDGAFETMAWARSGSVEVSESDTDGDGQVDFRVHFKSQVMSSAEYLDVTTGLPLRVEHFALGGKLATAEVDTDQDGTLDTRFGYTALAEVSFMEAMSE